MEITSNHIHFFISYAVAFIAFGLIGKLYLWPAIKDRDPVVALSPLLLYVCLRVNGLMFLMPGLVSEDLPATFSVPTAYGDIAAVIFALLFLWALRNGIGFALKLVYIFNVIGMLDLIYANIATFTKHVDPLC